MNRTTWTRWKNLADLPQARRTISAGLILKGDRQSFQRKFFGTFGWRGRKENGYSRENQL